MSLRRTLWETPPRDIVRKGLRRLLRNTSPDVEGLLRSPHCNSQRFYNFLARYEAILARTNEWSPIRFQDKTVLEVGCGPLLGFGPLAIFRGCRLYMAIEPAFEAELTYHPRLAERYFAGVHRDLTAVYGPGPGLTEFLLMLRERVQIVPLAVAGVTGGVQADIVLSNSALEHFSPLPESIAALTRLATADARVVHLVDFGNHHPTPSPFSGMYSVLPSEYRRLHGEGINLARPPDLLRAFQDAGACVALQPVYAVRESFDEPILSWWRDRYSDDDLFLKVALVFSA